MERHVVRAALMLLLAACAKAPAPVETRKATPLPAPSRAPIATDRASYVMQDGELSVVSTLTAPAGVTAHVTNCNGAQPMGLQRLVAGQWVNAWVAALNGCFSAPIVVRPGEQRTATLLVRRGAGAVVHPIASGTYRVVWFGVLRSYEARRAKPFDDELPLEQRVSAPFTIEVRGDPVS
jgi:hypothetical protein